MVELDEIDTDDDGALMAIAALPGGRRVAVEYEVEDDPDFDGDDLDDEDRDDLPSMEVMEQTVRHALARLTADVLDAREREVADELTEVAFEDDDEADLEEAVAALRGDIILDGIVVFGDGGMTLLYVAPGEYPGMTIFCLLDDDLAIDDLMVE